MAFQSILSRTTGPTRWWKAFVKSVSTRMYGKEQATSVSTMVLFHIAEWIWTCNTKYIYPTNPTTKGWQDPVLSKPLILVVVINSYLLLQLAGNSRPRISGPPPPHSEDFAYLTGRGDHQGCLRGMRINQAKSWGINPAAFSNPSCFLRCKNYNPYEYGVGILPRSWYYFVHSCWPCVSQPRKHQATKSERRFYESVRVVSNPYPLISGRPIGNSDQLWKYELRVRWLTQSTMGLYWGLCAYPSRGCWSWPILKSDSRIALIAERDWNCRESYRSMRSLPSAMRMHSCVP